MRIPSLVEKLRGVVVWLGLPLCVGWLALLPAGWLWEPPVRLPYWLNILLVAYMGTGMSLAVLIAYVLREVRRAARDRAQLWLPVYYLPTYVAGIESARELLNTMAYDCLSASCMEYHVTHGMLAMACALAVSVAGGAVAARLCGYRPRWGLPVHPVVIAILLGAALPWATFLHYVRTF